jgi:hypothetical protein
LRTSGKANLFLNRNGVGNAGNIPSVPGFPEGGVDAGKVVSDGINTVKQAWSAMDALGPIY